MAHLLWKACRYRAGVQKAGKEGECKVRSACLLWLASSAGLERQPGDCTGEGRAGESGTEPAKHLKSSVPRLQATRTNSESSDRNALQEGSHRQQTAGRKQLARTAALGAGGLGVPAVIAAVGAAVEERHGSLGRLQHGGQLGAMSRVGAAVAAVGEGNRPQGGCGKLKLNGER